jgi:hypothetical protein
MPSGAGRRSKTCVADRPAQFFGRIRDAGSMPDHPRLRQGTTAICAKLTAGIDVNQTLGIAAVDVAAGGKTPVHLGAMASPRRRTARFARASNALHPTLV